MRGSYFSDPESRAFLQRRVAALGKVVALIGVAATASRILITVTFGSVLGELTSPDFWMQVLAIVPCVGMWLIARRGTLALSTITVVETVGLVTTAAFYIGMGTHIPAEAGADTITAFILSFILFARAVFVPSTARHTIRLGIVIGIPLVIAMYFHYLNSNVQMNWEELGWEEAPQSDQVVAAISASVTTMWWTLVIGLSALASRVIHGLREEVRDIKSLGQYTLERKLGEGGMGVVFQATHGMLKRPTAIKLLRKEQVSIDAQERFRREVQLTAKLTHPHTVTIYDYGRTPDGLFYYAMELLDGATVAEIVQAMGPQPPSRVAHILRDAALALDEAHSVGLIHRDIKPSNIMLARQGGECDVTKVLDFGLVKSTAAEALDRTDTNVMMGTPQYLSPEAIQAPSKVCPQSDLYALGAVGYYLLAGRHVFEGATIMEVCLRHLQAPPTPVSEARGEPIPQDLELIVMSCLAKDREDRPSSGRSLAEALEQTSIPTWTRRDAHAWWEEFGPTISGRREEETLGSQEATVAIDLSGR